MSEVKKDTSEVESRSYLEIKEATENPPAPGSVSPEPKTPVPGAKQAEPPVPSKPTASTTVPTSLEEAQALIAKLEKERNADQSQIGKQSNEVGELREVVAKLQGQVEGVAKQPVSNPQEKPKSYVERFNEMESLKSMPENNRKVLGVMFDALKEDLKQELRTSSPELEQRVNQLQMAQYQQAWAQEATELQTQYGEIYNKHVGEIQKVMTQQWEEGKVPSVKAAFKLVAFDDVQGIKQQPKQPDAKDTLNDEAALDASTGSPSAAPTVNTKGLSRKEAFNAMLKDREKKGLPL